MNIFDALILGLIQGLTEFLPVSSSGHLEIVKSLAGLKTESSFYFTIAVHGATVLSIIVVFWNEIAKLLKSALQLKLNSENEYNIKIVVSIIPAAFIGFFFKDQIEELFTGKIVFVGLMLIVTSVLLMAGHFLSMKKKGKDIGYVEAFIIGIAQAVSVIPGISRSGATISTGLMLGVKKDEVTKFSFLMVLIPVVGANLVELFGSEVVKGDLSATVLITGFLAAFFSGYMACKWMISLVRRSKMIWFSVYCFLAGIVAIIAG